MSKIVQAVNAMISNPKHISAVTSVETNNGDTEIFFIYKLKYNWSMKNLDNVYLLFYYPGSTSMEKLIPIASGENWTSLKMVTYSTEDIGTIESQQSFSELYNILYEKVFGVDEMFNDILSDMDI
jgi:hypothetical protein